MAEAVVLICDRCGRQPAETVTLLVGGQSRKRLIDLCAAHRDELLELSRAPRRGPKTNRSTKRPSANRSTRRRATAKTTSPKRSAARKGTDRTRRATDRRDLAAEVKRLQDSGLSYRQIGEALMERGIKPQRAKSWNPTVIGRMLKRSAA